MSAQLQILAERYVADPTPALRSKVVTEGLHLVRALVTRTSVPDHPLASREDLESVGVVGLIQSLDQYDPERGTSFASFAFGRIRGALVDYLRSIDPLSREQRRRLAQIQNTHEQLRQRLGDEPSDELVANTLEFSMGEYHDLLAQAQHRFALSLHGTLHDDDEQTWLEILPDEDSGNAFEQVERDSTMRHVATLIKGLPAREQQILGLYYFENLTLRQIAEILGLTEARISQILGKTLLTLRTRATESIPAAKAA